MELRDLIRAQWDRVLAGALSLLGLLALLFGYLGVSDQTLPAAQIPYVISGGVVGLVLMGLGAAIWFSADFRDEWRKLDELERVTRALLDGQEIETLHADEASDRSETSENRAARQRGRQRRASADSRS